MVVDPRFSLRVGDIDGQKSLRFLAAGDLEIDEPATALFAAGLGELGELSGAGGATVSRIASDADRTILSNGWQSWCYGGELAAGERIPSLRLLPVLDAYNKGPGPAEARGEILSYFVTWVRSGSSRIALASRGDPRSATPPVGFRWDRRGLGLRAEAYAHGARLSAGELVAEIRLFHRDGYFAAKDALRDAFRGYEHFERLAFLAEGQRPAAGAPPSAAAPSAPSFAAEGLRPGGYESWYNHYTKIDDAIISADLAAIGANDNLVNEYYLRRRKPTVFQIDDGWEVAVGQWEPDARKFPRGMKALAGEIEERGMVPGIWIAPLLATRGSAVFRDRPDWLLRDNFGRPVPAGFNPGWDGIFYCLDISLPEVEEYLAGIFQTIVEDWGYRYLKLDFLYAGFLDCGQGVSPARRGRFSRGGAAYEHYDRLMRRLTSKLLDSRCRPVAYLGCGAPLEGSFRHFPLMRIGADTKEVWDDWLLERVLRHQGRPSAYNNMTDTIGRALLDGTVFVNDPDVVFCRAKGMELTEVEKELVALVGYTLASQLMFSDDAREFGESAEEAAFTARLVALFDRLGRREFGAERVARDVYELRSRDGAIRGVANLSGSAWRGPSEDLGRAIVAHAAAGKDGVLVYEPRSISLFELPDLRN
jgi:alpha-galactosidase